MLVGILFPTGAMPPCSQMPRFDPCMQYPYRRATYSPPEVDRIWLWVCHNKIPIYPIFYLLKGGYNLEYKWNESHTVRQHSHTYHSDCCYCCHYDLPNPNLKPLSLNPPRVQLCLPTWRKMLVSIVTRASLVVIWQQDSISLGPRVRVQSFWGLGFRGQSFLL